MTESESPEQLKDDTGRVPRRTRRVLFVDDEPAFLDITRIFLEKEGEMEIVPALSADIALALLREGGFDAVVADYQLPGTNGIELLKTVRADGDEVPFIIFTGWGREEIVIEALNSGADFYLQKGGDPRAQFAELSHVIRKASDHRDAQRALAESERRYRAIVEDQTEFISRFLPDGTHVFVNDAYCRYFGKRKEEILGKVFRPQTHPDDRALLEQFFSLLRPTKPVGYVEHRIVMPDGSVRWQRWSDRAIFDEQGEVIEYQSVGRDTTDRHEMLDALRESERRFRELAELLPQVVFETNEKGTVTFVNRFAYEMFGYTEQDLRRGVSIFEVVHEKDRAKAQREFARLREREPTEGVVFTGIRRNGSSFPFKVYATPIYRENVLSGMRGILIDISEQKIMEEVERKAFEQIEKNINQLSILNDHIRNPLAVIVGLADMEGGPVMGKILGQAKEIDRIITTLDMGWLESEKIREFMRKHYGVGGRSASNGNGERGSQIEDDQRTGIVG